MYDMSMSLKGSFYLIMKKFPNGFESWQETHYEVVAAITTELISYDELIAKYRKEK